MPKLAIYVPKKEMREIERWRKKINFSKVFMKALKSEIRDQSLSAKAPKNKLADAARKYRSLLVENSPDLVDFGYQLGSTQVLDCRLSPDQIHKIVAIEDMDQLSPKEIKLIEKALGSGTREIDKFGQQNKYDETSHPAWRKSVLTGVAKGIAGSWEQVCKQMQSV